MVEENISFFIDDNTEQNNDDFIFNLNELLNTEYVFKDNDNLYTKLIYYDINYTIKQLFVIRSSDIIFNIIDNSYI